MPALTFQCGSVYGGSTLLDTTNLYEHELIFLSPSQLLAEMNAQAVVNKGILDRFIRRLGELVEWVERGHTLVVLGLMPAPFSWAANNQGPQRTALEKLKPFDALTLTFKSGNSIQAVPSVTALFEGIVQSMSYRVVLDGPSLNPLLTVRTTHRTTGRPDIVAGFIRVGDGLIIYAPDAQAPGQPYWRALEALPAELHDSSKSPIPAWADDFRTKGETAAFDELSTRKAEVQELTNKIERLDAQIDSARGLKRLLVGTGVEFEQAVADALRELGLQVVNGPHPRADLLCTNGRRIAAVEAKGVDGGAKEEYVRQVMMWMPEVDAARSWTGGMTDPQLDGYVQQLAKLDLSAIEDKDCKGILVLGSFRQTPLDKRPQSDFPENPVAVMVRQDICALSGLQLFGPVMDVRANPERKEKIADALFATRGVLDLCSDWRSYLTMTDGVSL